MVTLIIFLLLFIRLAEGRTTTCSPGSMLLLVSTASPWAFSGSRKGSLFGDMFHTDRFPDLEKHPEPRGIIALPAIHTAGCVRINVTRFYMLPLSTAAGRCSSCCRATTC